MQNIKLRIQLNKMKLTYENLVDITFVLFFCSAFIQRGIAYILSKLGISSFSFAISCIIIYFPILLICLKGKLARVFDFLCLLLFIISFFAITYLFHPNYEFWYTRSYYGVWDYVLRPDNGIYAYLLIRMVNDPERIFKNLKISGWIMYVYFIYQLVGALSVGYWVSTDARGVLVHVPYDLSFGYNVLFFTLVFLYQTLIHKDTFNILGTVMGMAMILMGGSRGPILCIAIFILLYVIMSTRAADSFNKKLGLMTLIAFTCFALTFYYNQIVGGIAILFEKLGISSRTLQMLLSGNIAFDNGRYRIWKSAFQMIRDNPFGYGAMGTRHVIYYIHDVGHCHQVFLELLVDFGVFAGGAIIIFGIVNTLKILLKNNNARWSGLYLVFFARACQLLISGTFWHVFSFWACLGIGMCCYYENKMRGVSGGSRERR